MARTSRGDVLDDVLADGHRADELLQVHDGAAREHFADFDLLVAAADRQNLLLFVRGGIAHLDVEHEPVELGFRQRIGAFLLDRVLRGDGEERIGQFVRLASHRHFALLHGLQQRGLRFRRGAVDFVGQQDVGEDGSFHEAKRALAPLVFLQHVGAGDVGGHQVGRELNTLESDIEDLGQRADHQGLGQARHAFEQAVAAREDGGKQLLDDLVLPDDDFLQLLLHHDPMLAELLQDLTQISLFRGHDDPSSFSKHPQSGSSIDSVTAAKAHGSCHLVQSG